MFRYTFVILLWCLISVGCAQSKPSVAPSSQSIDQLETHIYQRLATDPAMARLNLRVHSNDGIVTLMGVVNSSGQRLKAVSIVRGTPGVRAVIDNTRQF